VVNNVASITVRAIPVDATATIAVGGVAVTAPSYSAVVGLRIGVNIIPVVCVAQNGFTASSYILTVTRTACNSSQQYRNMRFNSMMF
jgi:hypothetical protein